MRWCAEEEGPLGTTKSIKRRFDEMLEAGVELEDPWPGLLSAGYALQALKDMREDALLDGDVGDGGLRLNPISGAIPSIFASLRFAYLLFRFISFEGITCDSMLSVLFRHANTALCVLSALTQVIIMNAGNASCLNRDAQITTFERSPVCMQSYQPRS
jgi:hypothetical protein